MKDDKKEIMPLSTRKKILFSLITLFFLWFILDISLYVFLNILQKKYNIFFAFRIPNTKEIEGYANKYYHFKWGWDIFPEMKGEFGNRKGRIYPKKDVYTIVALSGLFLRPFSKKGFPSNE